MPASQTVDLTRYGYLELSIEAVSEHQDVYFTDQSPRFELIMRNKTDRVLKSREGDYFTGFQWILELGAGKEKTLAKGTVEFTLQPGETQRELVEPGLLGYEGNAVLGVRGSDLSGGRDKGEEPIEFGINLKGDTLTSVLYTFTIWDRSHYKTVHEHPKMLQKWIIFFAGLTSILAILQLLALLGIFP